MYKKGLKKIAHKKNGEQGLVTVPTQNEKNQKKNPRNHLKPKKCHPKG